MSAGLPSSSTVPDTSRALELFEATQGRGTGYHGERGACRGDA